MRAPDGCRADQATRRPSRYRRWRRIVAWPIILLIAFFAASARLLIWPAQGMPAHVDAIVVLGGQGNRLAKGLELARHGRASFLVVSEGLPFPVPGSLCSSRARAFRVICFRPKPDTTQGEAEFVGRLAREYRWRSVALVTTPDQDTRARIRFERCFPGQVYVVTTALPASSWPYEIAYQWGALFKAEVLQRAC